MKKPNGNISKALRTTLLILLILFLLIAMLGVFNVFIRTPELGCVEEMGGWPKANTTAQDDREGRPYGTDTTVSKPIIWAIVFVIIHNSIVETDNYPSLRNNTLTKGGYL